MNTNSFSKMIPGFMVFACLFILIPVNANAHFPWIQLDSYHPEPGEKLEMTIGFGHGFPKLASFLETGCAENVFLFSEKTKKKILPTSKYTFQSKNTLAEGSYVVASYVPYFSSKTPKGYLHRTKMHLDNVVKCEHNNYCMKSIVNVGKTNEDVSKRVGQPLEIIPLKNPGKIEKGGSFPVQVILNGDPLANKKVHAYKGSLAGNKSIQTVQTDDSGRAEIEMTSPGIWLVKTKFVQKYPNSEVCDVKEFIGSLTFRFQ